MPKMGLTMTTGIVGAWLKQVGDAIEQGESILEVTTEKIVNTVESPVSGVLLQIVAQEGDELPIGALLGLVGDASELGKVSAAPEAAAAPAPEAAPAAEAAPAPAAAAVPRDGKVKITPVAAKMAREHGIDVNAIAGTGPGGRITREDIEKALAAHPAAPEAAAQAAPEAAPAPAAGAAYDAVPYSGMRKAVGENMLRSWNSSPRVTHHTRADLSALLALRKNINTNVDESDKVSVTDMLIKILASAIESHMFMNCSLQGSEIRFMKDIHIGFAVALDNGLIVPVIRNANKLGVVQIGREAKHLAGLAKEGKLAPADFTGGTFTLSNIGAYGSVDFFSPIINPPEAAILGVGRTVEMPVVVDGEIVVRPMIGLSLTFDHRVVDGAPAAQFLKTLITLIENPYKAMF